MNEKRILSIGECPDGYKIADDVLNSYGSLVVSKNTTVNEYIRRKLMDFKVERISVFEPASMDTAVESPKEAFIRTKIKYYKGFNTIKAIINDLAAGRELDYKRIKEISGSLYESMYNNYAVIECLNQIKSADEYTYFHCINVSLYSMLIGKWMKLSQSDIKLLLTAGILHDVGKSKIPSDLLNKKGPLTRNEYDIIRMHPIYGFEIIKDLQGIDEKIKTAVLMHHEKENGTGYPFGERGESISYFAKIISIADAFDAMTSERAYKNRLTPFDTFREFERTGIGEGHYDPAIALNFLYNISQYYIGSKVMMATGKIGEIVYIPPHNISYPVVRVDNDFIDLSIRRGMKIAKML